MCDHDGVMWCNLCKLTGNQGKTEKEPVTVSKSDSKPTLSLVIVRKGIARST